jgi:hypothetical protein
MQITFEDEEWEGLIALAARELRDPRAQVRLLVRGELQRLGLLPAGEVRDEG